MGSFGEYLKKEREARSISLEEVSEATKIRRVFLEAIEDGDTDKLPANVFIKGFLRSYAKYLEVDSAEVLAAYRTYMDNMTNSDQGDAAPHKKKVLCHPILVIAPVAVILLISLMIYFNSSKKDGVESCVAPISSELIEAQEPPGIESVGRALPSVELDKGFPVAAENSEEEPSATASEVSEGEAASAEEDIFQIEEKKTLLAKASEMTWLRIQIDDKPPIEMTLKPGDSHAWTGLNGFKLDVGNAGGINLFYNGKEINRLGDTGQVVSLTLPNQKIW